jgi:hypothetical protein
VVAVAITAAEALLTISTVAPRIGLGVADP